MANPAPLPAFDISDRPIGLPMLCRPGSLDSVPDDPTLLASWKEDGWRALCAMTATGGVLRSRNGHLISQVPYIPSYLSGNGVPEGTVFDGELVDRARPRVLRRTGTILESARVHTPTDADPALTFAIFDVLFIAFEDLRDLPLHERLTRLGSLLGPVLGTVEPDEALPVVLLEHVPSTPEFAADALDRGKEGVVLKHRDSRYRHGARTDWYRHKPQDTAEGLCAGVVCSGPNGTGPVTSLEFKLESGATGQVASGLSDRDLQHITTHPEAYVGRLLELAHHGVERSGKLRHPVYHGVRHPADKAPAPRTAGKKTPAPTVTGPSKGPGNPRNYGQMGDTKLLAAETSLETRSGDAYERCMEKHSQDPDGDLEIVRAEINRRKLR
jgi:ATP-dependent DNA ligase